MTQLSDKPIAWVGRTIQGAAGQPDEFIVEREGMSRGEIISLFPPVPTSKNLAFNRLYLIKAIIQEAYQEARQNGYNRPRKNIRGFWYERIFYTLMTVMGETGSRENRGSIDSTINNAWKQLIEEGAVTYTGLNLYSEKEDLYHVCVKEDSPYPGAVIVTEKASLYEALHDVAETYEISFTATGGAPSRAAALAFVDELEKKHIDLSQDFTVYSFYDFDPQGWNMPVSFCEQLKLKLRGNINLVRLGILPGHISESIIKHQAIPYSLESKTARGEKGKLTTYENFIQETGGLYIPDPVTGEPVPARVELDIYSQETIREKIITGLSEHLEGIAYQVREFKKTIEAQHEPAWDSFVNEIWEKVQEDYEDYQEAIDDVDYQIDKERDERTEIERGLISGLESEIGDIRAEADSRIDRIETEKQAKIEEIEAQAEADKQEVEEEAQAAINERNGAIYSISQLIWNKTADLDRLNNRLDNLQDYLREKKRDALDRILAAIQDRIAHLSSPEAIARTIESNGGWHHWTGETEIEPLDNTVLAEAARQHTTIEIELGWNERQNIRRWIYSNLTSQAGDLPDTPLPNESPDDLIATIWESSDV